MNAPVVARLRPAEAVAGAGLAGGMLLLVAALAMNLSEAPSERVGRALSFGLLSIPPLLLALPGWLRMARGFAGAPAFRWLFGASLLAALVPERLVKGNPSDLIGIALYAAVVLLLTARLSRDAAPKWIDLPVVLLLWLPLELRWVQGDFVILRLFGLNLLLLLYVMERPVWEPGRLVPTRLRELGWALAAYVLFIVPAIPFALATGFAAPGLASQPVGEWALFVVATFWVVALPEEALFRGAMQAPLQRALRSPWLALLIASVVFGASHLNNATNVPAPDWRYFVLASVAGLAYGLAYLKTGNIAAGTLTHFLVDITWRGFFTGFD